MEIINICRESSFFCTEQSENYSLRQSKSCKLSLTFIEAEMINSFDYEDLVNLFSKTGKKKKRTK